MRTSKPFSTISYNSEEFLQVKLNELVQQGKIDFYAFIDHLPEEDEEKAHKHLFCVPTGLYDTSQLISYLKEFDPNKPDKPLGCIACKSSKFGDWYLYSCHDTSYLASKGQSRKYHYVKDNFIVSDRDYFREEIHSIDMSKLNRLSFLKEAVEDGISFESMVANGQVPIQQIHQYQSAYFMISNSTTWRAGRKGHEENDEQ